MRQVRILDFLRRPVEKLAERVHKLFGQLWFVRTRRKQRRMQVFGKLRAVDFCRA